MRRLAWIALGLAIAGALSLTLFRVLVSPAGRLIADARDAPWVMAEEPFSAKTRQWGRESATEVRFERAWDEPAPPSTARAQLRVRAFGRFAVRLNDVEVPFDAEDGRRWQRFQERDVGALVRAGANRIEVRIENLRGPALLALSLETERARLDTGSGFSAQIGAREAGPAVPARDVRRHPANDWLPRPLDALVAHGRALAAAFAFGAVLGVALPTRAVGAGRRSGRIAAGVALALLGALLLRAAVAMPLAAGFDARSHLDVIERIAGGRLPLATDGWSDYHPPLYHALVALLGLAGDALGALPGLLARRLPAAAASLGLALLAAKLARVLHPERPGLAPLAFLFAALLPVNLAIGTTISNEGLHALFAAGAVVWASEAMRRERLPRAALVAISCWLGAALLAKYTALVAVAVVLAFLLLRIAVAERGAVPSRERARDAAALVVPALLIAGWFYLRNVLVFGRALVPNWDLPGSGRSWWSAPGFHTLDYYLHFGHVFVEPWYASFVSFGDGLYATLFGDGLLSGAPGIARLAVPWDLDWMALGYLAALPIALLVLVGAGAWARDACVAPDGRRSAALGLPLVYAAALGFAIFFATLSLPYFGQARASYGLAATPVLALAFARGVGAVGGVASGRRARLAVRAALGGLVTAWAYTVLRSLLL